MKDNKRQPFLMAREEEDEIYVGKFDKFEIVKFLGQNWPKIFGRTDTFQFWQRV